MIEDILADIHEVDSQWRIARLRYFNPVGARESGLIGEYAQKVPNNLMPYVAQVAAGQREFLNLRGDDCAPTFGAGSRALRHEADVLHMRFARLLTRFTQSL